MAGTKDLYGDFGSVSKQQEVSGSGLRPFSVRADASDFGAQIGVGMQNLGAAGSDFAEQEMKRQKKEQDMINETIATDAEIKYASELAGLSVGYQSLSGLAAKGALPKYTQDVAELRMKYAETLPENVRPMFDTLANRHAKSSLIDANKYAAQQVIEADRQSAATAIAMSKTQAGYLPVARDDFRFGETLGDIHANVARQFADAPGLEQGDDGYFKFTDTPEAKETEKAYGKALDEAIGGAWQNRFTSLADQDPIGAYEKYEQEKQEIPSQFQVALDAMFYPKVRDAYANGIAGTVLNKANEGYSEAYARTGRASPVEIIMKNELHADGTIRVHADGDGQAIGGINSLAFPEQFAEASQILRDEGQGAAKEYIQNFYKKDIEARGIDKLPADVQDVVADGVMNHRFEVQEQLINAAKNGASRQELIDMRRKEYARLVATGEKKYTDAAEGWEKRLRKFEGGSLIERSAGSVRPPTNADYYKENYAEILDNVRADAENQFPDDGAMVALAVKKSKSYMDDTIRYQNRAYRAAAKRLSNAASGAFTNGQAPSSMDAIKAISPEMKSLVDNVLINQPEVYYAIDKQLQESSNTTKPKIPIEEQNKAYSEIVDEVAQWQIKKKSGKSVIGNEDLKVSGGDTSSLEKLIRIQNRILDESNRGVTGLNPYMKKVSETIIELVSQEQGHDDPGLFEPLETYDEGYQVIQDYLKDNNQVDNLALKARMMSDFIRMADEIPENIKSNPIEYKKAITQRATAAKAVGAKEIGGKSIPLVAIQYLFNNPTTSDIFDSHFGAGAAQKILGR